MLGLSGQYAQITKENMPYMRGLANGYGLSFIPVLDSIYSIKKGGFLLLMVTKVLQDKLIPNYKNPETSDKLNFNAYVNQNARNEYNLNVKHRFQRTLCSWFIISHEF